MSGYFGEVIIHHDFYLLIVFLFEIFFFFVVAISMFVVYLSEEFFCVTSLETFMTYGSYFFNLIEIIVHAPTVYMS